jgi:hypothetical protein
MAHMVLSTLPVAARILVWAIVLVPLGIFIWRRLQGIPIRGPRPGDDPPTPPSQDPVATPFVVRDPSSPSVSSSPTGGFADTPPAAPAPSAPAPSAGLARLGPDAGPASVEPAAPEPSASRGGFFAAGPTDPGQPGQPVTSPTSGRPTVAEAVQGIAMPCGLSPVIDGSSSLPNPFRVSFLTTLAPAPEVGRALADELERLGFVLSTAAPTELVARRGETQLRVVLFPTASSATHGLQPLFPAAPPGAVGVELST